MILATTITAEPGSIAQQTVADIVKKDLRKAIVFRKYGIDFCCGGHKSLGQVCEHKKIDVQALSAELEAAGPPTQEPVNADLWTPDYLIDHIQDKHHAYVRQVAPTIAAWAKKVASVHGHAHPEVVRIEALFQQVQEELFPHMMKEELVLFPHIRQLAKAKAAGRPAPRPSFGTVDNPIRAMENEHEAAGELMMEIGKLSDEFTPPADACTTFKALYTTLKDFEDDLFLHVHLENNVLFPKAKQLEKELSGEQ